MGIPTRLRYRMLKAVAGVLLALFWLELTHVFITPDIMPSWFTKVMAATDTIDPNGNGAVTGTVTANACGVGGNFDCLNDGVRNPGTPTTTDNYLDFGNGGQQAYDMETIPGVQVLNDVAVNVFHLGNPTNANTNMRLTVSLWNAAETVQYGTAVQFLNRDPAQWDVANFTNLGLTQADLDGLRVRLRCDRVGGGQADSCRAYAMYADLVYDAAVNIEVSAIGTQQDVIAGDTNAYVGGAFVVQSTLGSRNVTAITIAETGSIDAQNNINNVKLFYELDATDCTSQTYDGTETQYGTTVTAGFNAADGIATFIDSVSISTTQSMCVYVVLDVVSATSPGTTILLEITDPSLNVVGSAGSVVGPSTPVVLPGTTTVNKSEIRQTGYHWRNDDGSEAAASSATAGNENTIYQDFPKGVNKRLRFGVANTGTATSSARQYRLEYAARVTTCNVATGWTDVDAAGGDFNMAASANLTDGANTTNIDVIDGGVSDPAGKTFLGTNGGVRDTTSQTGPLILNPTQFTELEYSIIADATLSEGSAYCFRLSDAGTLIDVYDSYPELVIAADVRLSSIGSMPATVGVPQTNYYVGGAFVLKENSGSRTVDAITITQTGTVDGQAYLSNIKLFYDLSTTAPFDCTADSYNGTESQFGATATSFNTPQGTVTFSGTSVSITTSQSMCVYVVLDISESATTNDTLGISIAGGGADVVLSTGSIAPLSEIALTGSTTLLGSELEQYAYHWRNNDGSEASASSATGGVANTPVLDHTQKDPLRLRIGLNNISAVNAPVRTYRLEYGVQVTTCEAVGVWQAVDTNADWAPFDTAQLTHNSDTTNIIIANGGIADIGGKTFNGTAGVRTTDAQTASITILTTNYYELEFSLQSSSTAQYSTTYCFRLARADGTPLESYQTYPAVQTVDRRDFRVQRGSIDVPGNGLTLTAGTNYVAPSSSSTAFVRITGVSQTGSGPNADSIDTSAAITTADITTDFTIARPTGAAGSTRVTWELLEFIADPGTDNEMTVRETNALSFAAGTTVLNGPTVSVADDARVVVYVTGVNSNVTGANNYYEQQVTAEWDETNSRPIFRRGASTLATLLVSYAVVEYTGINWRVQRIEHTYTAANVIELENIPQPLNNISRSFTHIQKRMGAFNTVQNFGHRAWVNSIGTASFELQDGATTPGEHTTVMWIVENFQTSEGRMRTIRDLGSTSGGAAPLNITVSMAAIEATSNASIFAVARSTDTGNNRNFPRPLAGFFLNSTTTYQIWRGNTGSELFYATEVVEWPTHGLAVRQNYYRVYADNGLLTPNDPWPSGPIDLGENMSVTVNDDPLGLGDRVRLRIALRTDNATWPQSLYQFKIQYGERLTTCSAVSTWTDVGNPNSGEIWRLFDVASPANGTPLSIDPPTLGDLLLSVSTVAGVFSEVQPTVSNPYAAEANDQVEFDWPIEHNGATPETMYCFRVVRSDTTPIDGYIIYPELMTAGFTPNSQAWRWYDDVTNETPVTPLAAEEVAPVEVGLGQQVALRVTVDEIKGVVGEDVKFKLQFDESPNFTNPRNVVATSTCTPTSIWCYAAETGQIDNQIISSAVLVGSDACVGGVGSGCGTHNTAPTYLAGDTHLAGASREYAFYIEHAAARVGAVYYFRLFNVLDNEAVVNGTGSSYPSLVAASGQLSLILTGLDAGTTTASVTLNATSTPDTISFESIPLNTEFHAAHRIGVTTNATEGYRVLVSARQPLLNSYETALAYITSTNEVPTAWDEACIIAISTGCFGYHTTDATLSGNSARFVADDSYAALSTTPAEIMYSPIPISDTHDIIYKIWVNELQPAGTYETEIVYQVIPTF